MYLLLIYCICLGIYVIDNDLINKLEVNMKDVERVKCCLRNFLIMEFKEGFLG